MVESKFIISNEISPLIIHQIYLWFITSDKKVIVVSTKPGKYQLPGGKPKQGENHLETIEREVLEEAGLTLTENEVPEIFGYYLVKNDPNWPESEYIQLRYFVKSDRESKDIVLSTNDPDEVHKVIEVKFLDINKISNYINWMKDSDEYMSILEIIN